MAPREKSSLKRGRASSGDDSQDSNNPRRSQRISSQELQPAASDGNYPTSQTHGILPPKDHPIETTASWWDPEDPELLPLLSSLPSSRRATVGPPPPLAPYRSHEGTADVWGYLIPLISKDPANPIDGPNYGVFVMKRRHDSDKRDEPLSRQAGKQPQSQVQANSRASGGYMIGSDPSCDLVIDKPGISNRQFLLFPEERTGATIAILEDLSQLATFINRVPVGYNKSRELEEGDIISVGGMCFAFYYSRAQWAVSTNHRVTEHPLFHPGQATVSNDSTWMQTLLTIGYDSWEVADLVSEKKGDSPWIFFTPSTIDASSIQIGQHLTECAHQCCSSNNLQLIGGSDMSPLMREQTVSRTDDLTEKIEELCGLAGVKPSSRSDLDWDGFAEFREGNNIGNFHLFRHRILPVLRNLRDAIGLLQENGLCCDSFTILRTYPVGSSVSSQKPYVKIVPIGFHLIQNLEQAILAAGDIDGSTEVFLASVAVLTLVVSGLGESAMFSADAEMVPSYSALAVQFLTVGLLSYVQAHVGPLLPFFLDAPIQKIALLGAFTKTLPINLEAKLVNLTCLGSMTRGPVLAFYGSALPGRAPLFDSPSMGYDIRGRAEDILDTWGPGSLVFHENTEGPPVAIKIGDGFIYADSSSEKFHWARELDESESAQTPIDLTQPLLIGALVSLNVECQLSEAECRAASAGALEYLGTSRSSWHRSQRQLALQGGQYIVGQATETWNKQKGIPVKDVALSNLQHGLIQYLDEYWGIQVSYCTGVTRRVPLRTLVADLISHFPNDLDLRIELQQRLRNETAGLVTFKNWVEVLQTEQRSKILEAIQTVLLSLRHTGLDPTEKYFCIAWPWRGDTSRCFEVPLEGCSSWARMLADSHDCATFAYITMECLETSDIKCNRSTAQMAYQNNIHLLETAVTCPTRVSQAWSLKDGEVYFFSKLDSIFWVKVQREQAAQAASLVELAAVMSIPHDMRRRLHVSERKKQRARLRERSTPLVQGEMVAVFSMRKKTTAQIRVPAQISIPVYTR